MAGVQQVSFTSPYSEEAADIERRRALAQALQAQGQQGLGPTEMVGGWAIPKSPWEGLGKAAQQVSGAYQQKQLKDESKALGERYQSDLARTLMQAERAGTGSPAVPSTMYEDASGNAAPTDARAAVAPDLKAMSRILMGHPGTAPLGMAQMQKQMELAQRQQMMNSIMGWQAQGGAGSPPGSPPQTGGFGAGIPPQIMALMTSGDAELAGLGKALLEANKGVAQRPGAPVVNPFNGAVIAQAPPSLPNGMALGGGGPNGFTAAPVPGFAAAQAGIHEIPNASTPPVKLQTSGGQTIELSQPEYVAWQKTGSLPSRYSGQQPQSVQPPGATSQVPAQVSGQAPNEAAAIAAINQNRAAGGRGGTLEVPAQPAQPAPQKPAGLGVVGSTQTQEEQTRQARETEEAKAYGRERGGILAAQPHAEAAATTTIQNIERLGNMAKELHDHEGLSGVTGKMNQYSIGDVTPSTRAARGLQDSLVNQVGIQALQAMREASKTGGAVGAVTEREWPILQQSIAALSAAQATPDYQKALVNLQNQIKSSSERVRRAYEQTYPGSTLKSDKTPYVGQGRSVEGKIRPFTDPAQEQRYQDYRRANGG